MSCWGVSWGLFSAVRSAQTLSFFLHQWWMPHTSQHCHLQEDSCTARCRKKPVKAVCGFCWSLYRPAGKLTRYLQDITRFRFSNVQKTAGVCVSRDEAAQLWWWGSTGLILSWRHCTDSGARQESLSSACRLQKKPSVNLIQEQCSLNQSSEAKWKLFWDQIQTQESHDWSMWRPAAVRGAEALQTSSHLFNLPLCFCTTKSRQLKRLKCQIC